MVTRICTSIDVNRWLGAAVTSAQSKATSLQAIQTLVDSMTDPLSEVGHSLAEDVSGVAMQINRFRSMNRPLPHWTEAQQADPEGTLRQFAIGVFQRVGQDLAALRALQTGGGFFAE